MKVTLLYDSKETLPAFLKYEFNKVGNISMLVVKVDPKLITEEEVGTKEILVKLTDKLPSGVQDDSINKLSMTITYLQIKEELAPVETKVSV